MSVSLNLQRAIFARLDGAIVIDGTAVPIYDQVPDNAAKPYIVIGDDTSIDYSTQTHQGYECTLTIHVWSISEMGRVEVKSILGMIDARIHNAAIDVQDATLINIQSEYQRTIIDPDNKTKHGIIRFRAVVFKQ